MGRKLQRVRKAGMVSCALSLLLLPLLRRVEVAFIDGASSLTVLELVDGVLGAGATTSRQR